MSELSWPRTYRNLADRLFEFYKKNENAAGARLHAACQQRSAARELFPFLNAFRETEPRLDPVHVFASFNGQSTPMPLRLLRYNFFLELLCEQTSADFQEVTEIDLDGCPTPKTGSILSFRGVEADRQIWQQFAAVMEDRAAGLQPGSFDNLNNWKGLKIPAFTIFLFWIDTKSFLPLDNLTVSYLRSKNYLDSRAVDFKSYMTLLQDTRELDYVKISEDAFELRHEKSFRLSPEAFSFVPENERPVNGTLPKQSPTKPEKETLIGEFKMVALRVYKRTIPKWKRVLTPGELYQFSNAYDLSKKEFIRYDAAKDLRLFNLNGMSVSISALVGKNGSGKSTIVDLIYIVLNNLSERHPGITDKMEYVEGVHLDFYYAAEDLYNIELRGPAIKVIRYKAAPGGFAYDKEIQIADFKLEDLFYTVSLNYAHFALNSNHVGEWINYLFHKNDAYQQPLVLNPHRNDGNIEVNEEEAFANARLLSNLLYFEDNDGAKDKIAMFRELTDKQKAETLELSLNSGKMTYLYVIRAPTQKAPNRKRYVEWSKANDYWVEFVRAVEKIFELPQQEISKTPGNATSWINTTYKYILRKTISIAFKYKKYKGEYSERSQQFKKLELYLQRLKDDPTHVTYKLKQAINFLKYNHLSRFLEDKLKAKTIYSVAIAELSIAINEVITLNAEAGLKVIDLIPPSYLKSEVILTDEVKLSGLSSGEKQRIFAASTIAYHLINIDSANHDSNMVGYKFVNVIFDEIELYYHPEMQRTFVSYLLKYMSYLPLELAGLNITFVTHSPFILSDIPDHNIVFLGKTDPAIKTLGSNVHDLLANSFFLDHGFMGDHIKEIVRELARYLDPAETEFTGQWDPVKARQIINAIGEPLIKHRLDEMYKVKFAVQLTKAQRIAELKRQLADLE